ncbi:MAG: hypothetical protein ACOX0A_08725 [Thermoguttaceae bacterium]|jgi:hypothetical protein
MATIPTDFLFRYRLSCRHWKDAALKNVVPETLGATFRIPIWSRTTALNAWDSSVPEPRSTTGLNPGAESIFDFRFGWADAGLIFTVVVGGKEEQSFARHSELASADSLRLCLDTRDVSDRRRGDRFCYKFAFFPFVGESDNVAKPLAQWLPINRASEPSLHADVDSFALRSELRKDGYALSVFLPAGAITGYEPNEFNRIGMHYTVVDSKYGNFSLQHGAPLPFEDDPGLWSSFIMLGAGE